MKHYSPEGAELHPYSIRQPSHPLLPRMVPSEVEPHITALENAGIYDDLTQEQQATIIRLMQQAYRNGQAHQGAEKIDNDAVWLDGVGGLEKQPDGTWKLTMPDKGVDVDTSIAAAALGSLGGSANTPGQQQHREAHLNRAGRPKGARNKPKE